jgi:hypothetical protein
MVEYPIMVVIWEDHVTKIASDIPKNPDDLIGFPTITVGFLLSESDRFYLLAHDIERYEEHDESTYTIILKSAVISTNSYGSIPLDEIRFT